MKNRFLFPLLFLLLLPALHAELNAPGTAPAQPVPVKIKIERGKSVQIPLRIYGRSHATVEYRIRNAPAHGELSEADMLTATEGTVTYQHSGEFGHTEDSFFYSAKSARGVSAPAAVHIEIFDPPVDLKVPAEAEFGEVLIGTGAAVRVTIANEGGGIDHGTVTATSPWQISGNADYALGPGESETFTVVCAPEEEGDLHGSLKFSSSPAANTRLHATGLLPFRVEPSKLVLQTDESSGTRSGKIVVTEVAGLDQLVEIQSATFLGLPDSIRLSADASKELEVQIPAENVAEIDTSVTFTGTGATLTLPVTAPAIPARLVTDRTTVDFGTVTFREPASAVFTVRNRGGEKTFVKIAPPEPFEVSDEEADFALEPGEEREVTITLLPYQRGRIEGSLSVTAFESDLSVSLQAEVAATAHQPSRNNKPTFAESAAAPSEPESRPESQSVRRVSIMEDFHVESVTHTTATLAWSDPGIPGSGYRLEGRLIKLTPGAKKILIQWVPFEDVTYEESEGTVRATAKGLTPGGGYAVRVVRLGDDNLIVATSQAIQVVPTPKKPFRITPLKILLVILLITAALIARKRWRQHHHSGAAAYG